MGTYGRYLFRHLPELAGLAFAVWIQFHFAYWGTRTGFGRRSLKLRLASWAAALLLAGWCVFGVLAHFPSGYRSLPASMPVYWLRGGALAWAFASVCAYFVLLLWRRMPEFDPARRGFIQTAGTLAVAAPFGVLGFGMFIQRSAFRVTEVEVPVANLAPELNGLRIAHLSDIHMSPFLSEAELARAVGLANELKPHLGVITGDFITSEGDPLEACLRQLARLKAEAGLVGCMGNHEVYARCQDAAEQIGRRVGIDLLRKRRREFRFGNAVLNVAGVDWQRPPRMLSGTARLLVPSATNIMLSHNPNAFDAAAEQGWDLTLAGHTHGGQINVEILEKGLNPARFFTDYVYGPYRKGSSSLYVTRGIGTVGLPARIGAPPEVALIRLCAI
ncbi:MAG TPA: metallophosphoesterase [Bryobacteraceae bacterium]|nr:metallophosphoesterase [Bryobacteraceae bacterium]